MTSRILPVFLILIALGLFLAYVNPTYTGAVASLQNEIDSYDAALRAAEEYGQKEAELLSQKNAIPAEGLARVEAFLPDGVDNVQLILDLNALASRSGLSLSDFDIAAGQAQDQEDESFALSSEEAVDSLELSMSGIGTYTAFKTFLEGAESSLRPLDLVRLEIQDSQTGVYTYNMTFRIYWLATP